MWPLFCVKTALNRLPVLWRVPHIVSSTRLLSWEGNFEVRPLRTSIEFPFDFCNWNACWNHMLSTVIFFPPFIFQNNGPINSNTLHHLVHFSREVTWNSPLLHRTVQLWIKGVMMQWEKREMNSKQWIGRQRLWVIKQRLGNQINTRDRDQKGALEEMKGINFLTLSPWADQRARGAGPERGPSLWEKLTGLLQSTDLKDASCSCFCSLH